MTTSFNNFVGVIDSGVGGLTILQQLQRDFPCCNFVYIADSAHCPYGTKQPQDIFIRVQALIRFLQDVGAQAVVIACNTASVYADTLKSQFDLPIYDVITATCKRVVDVTVSKRVALLATNATVNSQVYQRKLNEHGVTVVSFACSEFVPFVEACEVETPECSAAVDRALSNLSQHNVDAVILGCTHFPILRKQIAPHARGATIVECCADFRPSSGNNKCGKTLFLTTGYVAQANNAAKWFGDVDFAHIDI